MPSSGLSYLSNDVLKAVISEVDAAFSSEGLSDVDSRVWSADVPDHAADPWALVEVLDNTHSEQSEDKDSPVEAIFIGVDVFGTEQGTNTPYDDVEALAKQVVQNMTGGFTVANHTIYEVRLNFSEPVSSTGPEQVDLFGRSMQFEVHIE